MQQEVIDIINNKLKRDKNIPQWIIQQELLRILADILDKENTSCLSKNLCSLRRFNDLEYRKITSSNYKRILREVNREDLKQHPHQFTRITFIYKIK